MSRLNVGIIGVGAVGRAHIEAVRRLGYASVAAVAVRDERRAQEICSQFDIPKYYPDYRDLLDDAGIAAVHNCTPNRMHYAVNREAVGAGKHVLSEKPLAVTAAEAAELTAAAENAGVRNGVNFIYRHFAVIQHLRWMIAAGELGDIFAIHGSYLQDWLLYETDYNWRVEPEVAGPSRAVADIGSHWCDMAQYLVGAEIREVVADLGIFIPERLKPDRESGSEKVVVATEDYGSVLLRFANGVKGCFTVSQVSSGRKSEFSFQIDGSKAAACWNQEYPHQLWLGFRDQPNQILLSHPGLLHGGDNPDHRRQVVPERWPDAQKSLIDDFYQSVLEPGKEFNYATFATAHSVSRVVEAVLRSQAGGSWQKVV